MLTELRLEVGMEKTDKVGELGNVSHRFQWGRERGHGRWRSAFAEGAFAMMGSDGHVLLIDAVVISKMSNVLNSLKTLISLEKYGFETA